jgi:hypothetical protein
LGKRGLAPYWRGLALRGGGWPSEAGAGPRAEGQAPHLGDSLRRKRGQPPAIRDHSRAIREWSPIAGALRTQGIAPLLEFCWAKLHGWGVARLA